MKININKKTYEKLEEEIKKIHYDTKRYNLNATFGLLYFNGNLTDDDLKDFMRLSDYFLKLNENYYFLNFYHTNEEDAIKASENLIFNIDKKLNNSLSYIAVDRIDPCESTTSTINRLFQILTEAKKHKSNRVEDETILNKLF